MKKIIFFLIICAAVYFVWGRAETVIKNADARGNTIVAFGDSLTYGKGAARDQTYPAYLMKRTGKNIINAGLNGDTAAAAPRRFAQVTEQAPYMVLIEFGGNDFMRSVPFEQTLSAMAQMVDRVQEMGAIAVIVDTGGYYGMKKYTKAYKKLAREKGALFVPGILDGVFGERALMSDQVHPNAAGYEKVADKVYKHIQDYL